LAVNEETGRTSAPAAGLARNDCPIRTWTNGLCPLSQIVHYPRIYTEKRSGSLGPAIPKLT
jgi:hypothetical protein